MCLRAGLQKVTAKCMITGVVKALYFKMNFSEISFLSLRAIPSYVVTTYSVLTKHVYYVSIIVWYRVILCVAGLHSNVRRQHFGSMLPQPFNILGQCCLGVSSSRVNVAWTIYQLTESISSIIKSCYIFSTCIYLYIRCNFIFVNFNKNLVAYVNPLYCSNIP